MPGKSDGDKGSDFNSDLSRKRKLGIAPDIGCGIRTGLLGSTPRVEDNLAAVDY
ncbi:hypothetical protein AGMMS50256_34730 [Betaproteobacteria bacterium]|nr:hypothetical protein AGMMS50256_34730 [Betaproteobacteria bacterium]